MNNYKSALENILEICQADEDAMTSLDKICTVADKSLSETPSVQAGVKGNGDWVRAKKRLPGMNKVVKWRNADGGNIDLGENTFLDQYAKVGVNTSWHEWFDETASAFVTNIKEDWESLRNLFWEVSKMPRDEMGIYHLNAFILGYEQGKASTPVVSPVEEDAMWESIWGNSIVSKEEWKAVCKSKYSINRK